MRAFATIGRAAVSFYSELFLLASVSLLWWVTGGIFVGAAVALAWMAAQSGLAGWYIPLIAIPAGPATAALANVGRPVARDLRVDRSVYWEGFRHYWRQALAVNALSMLVLSVLAMNTGFYWRQNSAYLHFFAIFWFYLFVLALGTQLYLFPVLVGLKEPGVWSALKTSAIFALANPIYTALLTLLALALTALAVGLTILLPLAWPAVMSLMGEHSLLLFVRRAGRNEA